MNIAGFFLEEKPKKSNHSLWHKLQNWFANEKNILGDRANQKSIIVELIIAILMEGHSRK